MEIILHLLLIVFSTLGFLFGVALGRAVLEHQMKPKDFRTYGKGVNKNDY